MTRTIPKEMPDKRWISPLVKLRRHPFAVRAEFKHCIVITFAFPKEVLEPLLPPGLELDLFGDFGFVAVAMVQTRKLRPAFLPRCLGQDFFLSGRRIFARFKTGSGRTLRGLRILRSDTDNRLLAFFGNRLTHYQYRPAKVLTRENGAEMEIKIKTPHGDADLHLIADLGHCPETPPPGSPFPDMRQARLFAGPLPYTFDYEPESHSIIKIEGVRQSWKPKPFKVQLIRCSFFDSNPFHGIKPVLANAFHIENIDYMWKAGIREPLGL